MAWLYEKSPAWRRLVAETKGRPWVLAGFTAACCGVAVALGAATMAATNNTAKEERLRQELERKASSNSQLLSKVNNERLHEYLQEIHRKENNDDRYQAAIRRVTRQPGQRTTGCSSQGRVCARCPTGQAHLHQHNNNNNNKS
eukprot:jgi/Chlat1/252/Chrsp1S08778